MHGRMRAKFGAFREALFFEQICGMWEPKIISIAFVN